MDGVHPCKFGGISMKMVAGHVRPCGSNRLVDCVGQEPAPGEYPQTVYSSNVCLLRDKDGTPAPTEAHDLNPARHVRQT